MALGTRRGKNEKTFKLVLCFLVAGLSNATAETYRFTASSPSTGVLGYMDFDSSAFDGMAVQFVFNTSMLGLHFTNPTNGFQLMTIGPTGDGTYFNSTGSLPVVLAGNGRQGGTGTSNEVVIVTGSGGFGDPSNLILGDGAHNNLFADVTWNASVAAVPEPEIYAMMAIGLGLVGWAARRKRQQSA